MDTTKCFIRTEIFQLVALKIVTIYVVYIKGPFVALDYTEFE